MKMEWREGATEDLVDIKCKSDLQASSVGRKGRGNMQKEQRRAEERGRNMQE